MASVGVVVVTYRSAETIRACLSSLARAFSHDLEVVVVDNNSPDDSAELAGAAGFRVIRLDDNVGYGQGNNAGIAALAADTEVVVFANPDTRWPVGSIDALVAALAADPSLGLVSPLLVGDGGAPQAFVERDLSLGTTLLGMTRLRPPIRPLTPVLQGGVSVEVEWLHTAAAVVPIDVLRATGGFDPRFFLFAEDADLCRRIRAMGRRVAIAPGVSVTHIGGASVAASHDDDAAAALRTRALATYLEKFQGKLARRAFGAVGTVVYGLSGHRGQAREAWKALVQ